MVAYSWYPIHYFHLSFGKGDSLCTIVEELHRITGIPIDATEQEVVEGLKDHLENAAIKAQLQKLTMNVPYRFLMPWIGTTDNREMVQRSLTLENNCLYSIHKECDEFYILINAAWSDYLNVHYPILRDFTFWNLTCFLQKRNPNVPAIPNKLIRPNHRASLSNHRKYWNDVIKIGGPIECIYTGISLGASDFDLDHFIPWSFVSHDLIWNLIPANGSINSSKSDKLPDLHYYLPKLAQSQQRALKISLNAGKQTKLLEDFLYMGCTAQELVNLSAENLLNVFERNFNPISQIALNMGFETWKY